MVGGKTPTTSREANLPADEKLAFENHVDSVYDEEEIPATRESDFKHKQIFRGWSLLFLAYQSTGVIYGDIGTSPLYVFSSTFSSEPGYDDLLGALSLIIWAITLIVTVKYVFVVLCADDEGEGGTFAMYNLLSRYCDITKRDPKSLSTVKIQRYTSTELRPTNHGVRSFIEQNRMAHLILKILAVFGVSLIMADGILTPAQSVLGAIQGLNVVKSDITTDTIVGISCTILVLLFLVQPLGIHRLSSAFAPIVIVWLLLNLSFGIYNLIQHDWTVLKAFSPYFAGLYFVRNGTGGWKSLGGILLAFTGVEALFADMGAFSKRAVQLGWLCLAFPSLLLAYIGQAAFISRDPSAYSNPFFKTVPPHMFYPSLVVSILAAIVASQALITSTFQLLSQVMNSSYFPHIKLIYTSDKYHGQVYIPIANWLMMIGTVIVTAVYHNTTRLGNAYGVCVIMVTFITTSLVALVALIVWRMHWLLVFVIWLPFVTLDGLFLSASLVKVPDGAWFTILLAMFLSSIFVLWRYGKEQQWASEGRGRSDLTQLVLKSENGTWKLPASYGGRTMTKINGIAIFFDKTGDMVPTVYEEFLRKFESQPDVQVFLHLRALCVPHVTPEERFTTSKTALPNCYRLTIRHGYNDIPVTEDLGNIVYYEIRKYIVTSAAQFSHPTSSTGVSTSVELNDEAEPQTATATSTTAESRDVRLQRRLDALDAAMESQVVYIVGKEQLRLLAHNNIAKRFILSIFLWVRDNTRAKVSSMRIPVEKLVEVGFVKEI
ncbi:hypothetical protein FKW77_000308 [Venturia effusa]|uniref:Potassium uptake protein n=1 Tax=Venturia effusa TaxID=50376 RepID=A0A517LA66_9PEZI|nr:hypothetical protein FKW77_000308 [Venturia effusa]